MKLLFPNDEHAPVALDEGTVLVGSAPDCGVRLTAPGIAAHHCELISEGGQARVRPLTAAAPTVLNGKQVAGEAALKPGDLLLFAKIGCRIVAAPRVAPAPAANLAEPEADDPGHTRVRMALPKYLLRGVSGATFGKIYAMVGTLSVGRSSDNDISIPSDEISRQHAKLQSAAGGIVVEDLGSANGTFINDQRVHTATLLKPGDEVRFDTVRFLLMSPSQEMPPPAAAPRSAAPAVGSDRALWIIAGVVVLAAIGFGVARYLGMI